MIYRKKGENLQKQKEIRRRVREEKRKAKILKKLEITGSDEINEKIAKEEKKLIKVQRRLEAIRLVEELFKRIKDKNEGDIQHYSVADSRGDELKRLKDHSELDYLSQKEKLHNAVKGRVMLKSILSEDIRPARYSDSSESELSLDEDPRSRKIKNLPLHPAELMYDNHPPGPPPMYGYPYQPMYTPFPAPMYPDIDIYAIYRGGRGRGGMMRPGRGRGRGGFNRGRGAPNLGMRGQYPAEVYEEYSKFYNKPQHDSRRSRSPSSRRRRSRSATRRRSYSRSRSRSYSRRRSRSRSRSRSRRHSRHDSRSRTRSRSNRRNSRSTERSKSKSRKESRSERRSRSRSKSKTRNRRSRSRSKTRNQRSRSKSRDRMSKDQSSRGDKDKSKSKSKSREKSVDSSKFMTPRDVSQQNERERRSRSKSWSLPREDGQTKGRSWSKSPKSGKNVPARLC